MRAAQNAEGTWSAIADGTTAGLTRTAGVVPTRMTMMIIHRSSRGARAARGDHHHLAK